MSYRVKRNKATGKMTLEFYTTTRGQTAHRGRVGYASRRVLQVDAATGRHYHATKGWRGGPIVLDPREAAMFAQAEALAFTQRIEAIRG